MPQSLTPADVRHIASLARLQLTEEEATLFVRQLGDILAFADQVRDVDTTGIAPFAHAGSGAPLRPDRPEPCLPRDALLEHAPDANVTAGLFKVPRVLGS
jgi:aspartyl-tRNA(Asn)/glutamyl-tRNA(Gln) amidotransferase subunit C